MAITQTYITQYDADVMLTALLIAETLNDDFIAISTAKNGIPPLIENAARLPSQNHQLFWGWREYPVKNIAPKSQDAATTQMITQSPTFLNISTLAEASGTLLIASVKTAVIKIVISRYSMIQPTLTMPRANLCRSKYIFFLVMLSPSSGANHDTSIALAYQNKSAWLAHRQKVQRQTNS